MTSKTKRADRRSQPSAPAPKKLPILPILGGIVGLALVVAIGISIAGSAPTSAEVEIGTPTVDGQALGFFNPQTSDADVGSQIPTAIGTDFDGNAVTIGPDIGPAAIVFLAHWCSHCQAEVPAIQKWLDGGAEPLVPLYSVASAIDKDRINYPPWTWLDREGWSAPVLVDDAEQTAMRAFGGSGFPYWVFINDEGLVVARASGEIGVEGLQAGMARAVAASS